MRFRAYTFVTTMLAFGCATHTGPDSQSISEAIRQGTGAGARLDGAEPFSVPPGIFLDDGLTRDEAVAIALWNNADFQVAVAGLGFARADLLEAGLLPNPVLALLFPIGPKQLEWAIRYPIDVLWERPRRVAAARAAADAAASRLVQTGLDLAAATKQAYEDLALSQQRLQFATDAAALNARISDLTATRLAAGDIGELEARAARVDSARAQQEASRARHDVTIAAERLRGRLGLPNEMAAPALSTAGGDTSCGPAASLLRSALAARPDVRAAELTIEAAGARLGWEKSKVLALTAVLDANGGGSEGFEMGPGVDLTIPLFNFNQAGKARAVTEMKQAAAAYTAVRQRVALEIVEASTQFDQAAESRSAWRTTVVEPLEVNAAAAERSFASGDTSFLFVLENSRRLVEAQLRAGELDADVRRARARIERAVGANCR